MIAKLPPDMAKLTKGVLRKMRSRLPGATELVYEKKRSLVISFCPDDHLYHVINSIATYTRWLNLYFYEGDHLPDPERLLQGDGVVVRHIRITDGKDLDRPAIKALMKAALDAADPPLDPGAKRRVIIRQSL